MFNNRIRLCVLYVKNEITQYMVAKSDVITGGAFRSQWRADNEFSLNLWKAVNIEGYNGWDLIGLWMFIRALFEKKTICGHK